MDGNIEFLNYIYQNSQMGVDTLNQLKTMTNDQNFSNQLNTQLQEYENINTEAKDLLKKSNQEEKDISKVSKVKTYMSIGMQTMTDKSPSHISEMLIQGSTMGVIDATKNLKKYGNTSPEIVSLGQKLLQTEENNVHTLKSFL